MVFIKGFINIYMGLEVLCGDVEIERVYWILIKVLVNNNKKFRLVYVVFLRYIDKVKILFNVVVRLKDNFY